MSYERILTRLYGVPLLISSGSLEVLTNNVILPLLLDAKLAAGTEFETSKQEASTVNRTGIINISGSLVSKNGAGSSFSTSYEGIVSEIKGLIASGVNKIGFNISSGGGESNGLFPLMHFISSLPEKFGISTFSFSDDRALSAAYGILSSSQRVYTVESAFIGSIGALAILTDSTEQDSKEGIKHFVVRSREEKALVSGVEKIDSKILDRVTNMVREMDGMFSETITKVRPIVTSDTIKAAKGSEFFGKKALELGLVDTLVTSFDEVLEIEATIDNKTTTTGINMTTENTELVKVQQKLAETKLALSTLQGEIPAKILAEVGAEKARVASILKAGTTLKMSASQVEKRILAGTSEEATLEIFTAIAEAGAAKTEISSGDGVAATSKDNVVMLNTNAGDVAVSDILKAAKGE